MKSIFYYLLLVALLFSGTVQAQRFTPKATNTRLAIKSTQPKCQEVLAINVQRGQVHTPQHTATNKVRTWVQDGQFYIQALAPIQENDFIWAKFYMNPGFPGADITGLHTVYQVKPSPNNSAKLCYISQSRMVQGPNANTGTVRLDDGKNLFGTGQHQSSPFGGQFACGNDYKTVSYKLVMQRGDIIVFKGVRVLFDCPGNVANVCPQNLPNPLIQLAGTEESNGFVRYRIPVVNHHAYPGFLFSAAPTLPACGLNTNASRTWVDIYNEQNQRIYGFCALGQPSDLKNIWFAVKKGERPPYRVRIIMRDRICGQTYASNWISIPNS